MKNYNTAKVYAASFLEITNEKNIDLAKELTSFNDVINTSNDLENLFFLDVFTIEEKMSVFNAISTKINLSQVTNNCIKYLIQEKRLSLLPLIYKEVIVIDDDKKGFLRGVIEGAGESINETQKNKLIKMLKSKINKEPKLEYKQNSKISAGFKITVDDMQLDASVDNQLKQFKQSILGE